MALTRYPEGSLRELWKMAFPLMLSSLSVTAMVFVDRLLLANYAPAALNAVANAMTLGWAFIFGWMVLAGIAEVFVAQYNGAGQTEKLGEPVWQMIWLSLFSSVFFLPMGLWGGQVFYGPDRPMEQDYFSWMILFGSSYPLYSALCGFFIGQGKTYLITGLAIAANLVNACLDVMLIFGVGEVIPSLGVAGAAIGTSCSAAFQVLILAVIFLLPSNRRSFGTGRYTLQWQSLWQCVRIGLPGAIFMVVELFGWTSFYYMMTLVGESYITVASIGQSLVIFLYFFAEGVNKAVSTIAGNLIGAKKSHLIPKVILSGLWLHVIFLCIILSVFIFFSTPIMQIFLSQADASFAQTLHRPLQVCFLCMCVYLFFEGIRLVFSGILTAAGDTFFLFVAGILSVWLLLVMPIYLCIVQWHMPIETAFFICILYSMGASGLYIRRYWQGKWQAVSITV